MNEIADTLRAQNSGAGQHLRQELARWREAGLVPRVFLRDDDAIENSPALHRLLEITNRLDAPLLLAIIPYPAKPELGVSMKDYPLVAPAVHGFRHIDHSPFGKRARELGLRPVDEVLAELRQGRNKLEAMFGERLSGILVPPWNRIDADVAARVGEAGFTAISTHGWPEPEDATLRVNTHVDIVHWSGGAVGRSHEWVFGQLADNLATARGKGGAAIGLLTHHLAHDEQAWNVLEAALSALAGGGVQWVAADELVPAEASI